MTGASREHDASIEQKEYIVQGIEYWDLNKAQPTSRILSPTTEIVSNSSDSTLHVTLNYFFRSRFLQRKKVITDFRITFIFLFPDFIGNTITTIPVVLPEKKLKDQSAYSFIQPIPAGASSWLICFKAEACVNGVPIVNSGHVDKAMCLLESGIS